MFILLSSLVVSIVNVVISFELISKDMCTINYGVAFGIGIEYIIFLSLLLLLSLVVIGVITKGVIKYMFFSLFLLGLSNFVIRILYGSICDYINIFNLVINISDLFIVLISIYAGVYIFFFERKK